MAHYLSLSASQNIFADDEESECCFSWLMKDVILVILSQLSLHDAVACFKTAKLFHQLSRNTQLWRSILFNMLPKQNFFVIDKFISLFHLENVPRNDWGPDCVEECASFANIPCRWICMALVTPARRELNEQTPILLSDDATEDLPDLPINGDGEVVVDADLGLEQLSEDEEDEFEAMEPAVHVAAVPHQPQILLIQNGLATLSDEFGVFTGLFEHGQFVLGLYGTAKENDTDPVSNYIYGGEFRNGKWDGLGVTVFPSGGSYVGEYWEGQLHGEGVLVYQEGDVYDGEWVQNVKTGFGCYRWISGNTYTGMWKENRREGKIGELRWANGDLYYGEWIDNKRTGVGVLRWAPSRGGGVYVGEFFDNQLQGFGTFHFRNMRYDGNWHADRREKEGKLTWPNGDVYTGNWVHGARNGSGVFVVAATGQKFDQVWSEPEDVKYSQITPQRFPPPPNEMKHEIKRSLQ